MNYTRYQCPVCNEEMANSTMTIIEHNDQHITNMLYNRDSDLISEDGTCKTCGGTSPLQRAA